MAGFSSALRRRPAPMSAWLFPAVLKPLLRLEFSCRSLVLQLSSTTCQHTSEQFSRKLTFKVSGMANHCPVFTSPQPIPHLEVIHSNTPLLDQIIHWVQVEENQYNQQLRIKGPHSYVTRKFSRKLRKRRMNSQLFPFPEQTCCKHIQHPTGQGHSLV